MKTLEEVSTGRRLAFRSLHVQQIAILAVLIALEVVLSYFSISTGFLKVTFTFITVGLIAKWYGPYWGIAVAFIADFLTTMMSGQAYIFPFALIAVLNALIFGISYYNRAKLTWWRLLITIFIQLMLSNAILNTWLLAVYHFLPVPINSIGDALASPIVWVRVAKQFVMLPIEVLVSYLILNNAQLEQLRKRIFSK
ncbi:MAG: folate family ECF transporter S component [Lactobacillaceae bacterium]|jgi:ECF transporter S component (folate family)|nr:folate family ECF transporter S component [Lactobacillaceae bacterium]